ncbi:3-hydroxyacyl-CoA dehydrogenase family protein [Novosphingobium colocasiae]
MPGVRPGYPVGPLALLDEVAIDLAIRIVDQAIAQEGDAYEVPPGVEILRRMKELGRLGRKTSAGFYEYDAPGGKRLWPGLAAEFPAAAEQPDSATLKERYLYAQALESARCVEDGIIEHAIDADLGSIFGIGYPAWTGGALGYIDTVGVKAFVARADDFAARFGPRFTPPASLREKAAA